jgi:hypothetical protein
VYFHLTKPINEEKQRERQREEGRGRADRLARCSTYFNVLLRIGSPVTVATS